MNLGGTFTFPGTSMTVNRVGYGAMQLPGPGVFGPPRDHAAAIAVLREAVRLGINHIDTSDFYGPHVANQLIREALHPYPKDLVIVTKIGGKRGTDKSWQPAYSKEELISKLMFLINSPAQRIAVAVNGVARNLAVVIQQIAEQKGGQTAEQTSE